MLAEQPTRLRSTAHPPCPKCRPGILQRTNLSPGLRALSPNIFQCNRCYYVEIATKAEGTPHGELQPRHIDLALRELPLFGA
jgi:hypothetical protein